MPVWNFCKYKKHAATFSKLQRIKNMFNQKTFFDSKGNLTASFVILNNHENFTLN